MNSKRKGLAAFLVNNFEMDSGSGRKHEISSTHSEEGRNRSKNVALQNYHQIMEMETVIVEDLIMPLVFIMKYAITYHDTITYDAVEKKCVLVKASLYRKIFCIFWQATIVYRLSMKVVPGLSLGGATEDSSEDHSGLSDVAKGAYFIFICFSFLTFYIFWMNTKGVCDILNHIIGLSGKLQLREKTPPRFKIVKCVAHFSWSFVLGYIAFTIFLYLLNIFYPELTGSTGSSANLHLNGTNATFNNGSVLHKKPNINFIEIHTSDDFILVQVVTAVASFMNIFGWMMTFFHLGVWATIFRQLIVIFYWRINAMRELGHFFVIPEEIRTFNKIGCIIDMFNQIFGLMCLFGTVVVVTYISPSLKHALPDSQNILKLSVGLHLLLSYVPMTVVSFLTAEVQRVAGNFAGILKEEYGRFSQECGDPAESLCGISIVHYDLATTNIGIKGSGFFTVSYQFMTTIASLIVTYSILVIQLFPKDNSVEVP